MKTSLLNRLNYLHRRIADSFGNDDAQTVWLKNGSAWIKIPVMQASLKPAQKEAGGLLSIATDTILLFIRKGDWPAVAINDVFHYGPPSVPGGDTPAAAARKFIVTGIPASPQLDWQRVEAAAH